MIYCSLKGVGAATLFVEGLFSDQFVNPGASFTDAMEHPIKNIPVSSAEVDTTNPAFADQGVWIGAGQLSRRSGVMVPGLTVCAAVLFYDEESNLIGAGHAAAGIIDDDMLRTIENTVNVAAVQYIVYATPSFASDAEKYKTYVSNLTGLFDTKTICIVDGFGTANMGVVIGDMRGNILFNN